MPKLESFAEYWKARFHPNRSMSHQFGFAVGQNLYTPERIGFAPLIPDDRPYGAVLYGSVFGNFFRETGASFDRFQTIELQVGMVGPIAQGEYVQQKVHKAISNTIPLGWDNQIKNEPILNVNFSHQQHGVIRPSSRQDFTQHWGLALGNLATRANAGGTLRIGRNLSSFPVADIGNTSRPIATERASGEEYGFLGADARLIGRNIFLDGNTFSRSHRVSKKPFVVDLRAGYHWRRKNNYINYTFIHRSSEFRGPKGAGWHDIGSVTFGREL
jgi:lipid A 3-O-deacylase